MSEHTVSRLTRQHVAQMLLEPKDTVILLHARPDGDAIGSAFALRLLLESMGMRAYCLGADDVPGRLRFLTEGIQSSILPDSLPDDFAVERVVSVDVASPTQLGSLAESWLCRVDAMIDHHATGTPYAPAWIVPEAAATGELVYALAEQWHSSGALNEMPARAAELIYAAIASDTGGFRYSNVTPRTHEIAAGLLGLGIDAAAINHALFECKPYELMLAEQLGFSQLRRFVDGKVSVIPFSYACMTEHGLLSEHLETLVDVARSIEGTQLAIAIRQPSEQGRYRVSVRSNGAFSAATLCAAFGGGGHEKAAGCTVEADGMETVIERLLEQIERQGGLA